MRFFAVNTGAVTTMLKIDVIFWSGAGTLLGSAPVDAARDRHRGRLCRRSRCWRTARLPPTPSTSQVEFEPVGENSGWRIDDVYVDPRASHEVADLVRLR